MIAAQGLVVLLPFRQLPLPDLSPRQRRLSRSKMRTSRVCLGDL